MPVCCPNKTVLWNEGVQNQVGRKDGREKAAKV